MKTFPRCNALLLAIVVLFGSLFGLAQTTNTDSPAAAQSQGGQQVQLEGQLEIIHQDFKDGRGKYVYSLKQSDGTRIPLKFTKQPPTHLLTGDHVQANGQMSGGSLLLYSGSNLSKTGGGGGSSSCTADSGASCSTTSSIPVPYTFGNQSVLVILVNFQDDAVQPYTVATAQNTFFGTGSTLNSFILENSYGQTSITGTVVGWYTIPESITTCNISQIATDAQNAATASGVSLSNYTRYVYAFPTSSACGFAGASDVGGNPSESWINGTTGSGGTALDIHIIDHELGHAFGLWHSHSLDCGTTATICSSGTVAEYGDLMDVMGTPQTASADYNAFQKAQLGWLNYGASPSIQTVTSSSTYTIYPYELGGTGPNALKVLQSTDPTTGAKTWYYLESRQAIGFDAFLTGSFYYTQNETTGVLFHLGTDGDGGSSLLLDMTPATPTLSGWWDMSLPGGQSFSDPTAGVTFTPTAVSSTGATVQITFGSCIAANPTVGVSPSVSQYVSSGTAVSFTVTVTDHDTSSCAPATFNLGSSLPSGWTGAWSAPSLSLSPGKSGSAILTVTSPVGTADGSYNVGVNATNASASTSTGSAVATYVINTAPLSTSVATNQPTYQPGQTVTVLVTMLYGALPDVGASVTVTVTTPGGKTASLSGTTGSTGVAALNFKLSNHATAGTYQVQVGSAPTRTAAAATTGASTSFTVQ